jgi:prophage antirepressor-like protein
MVNKNPQNDQIVIFNDHKIRRIFQKDEWWFVILEHYRSANRIT